MFQVAPSITDSALQEQNPFLVFCLDGLEHLVIDEILQSFPKPSPSIHVIYNSTILRSQKCMGLADTAILLVLTDRDVSPHNFARLHTIQSVNALYSIINDVPDDDIGIVEKYLIQHPAMKKKDHVYISRWEKAWSLWQQCRFQSLNKEKKQNHTNHDPKSIQPVDDNFHFLFRVSGLRYKPKTSKYEGWRLAAAIGTALNFQNGKVNLKEFDLNIVAVTVQNTLLLSFHLPFLPPVPADSLKKTVDFLTEPTCFVHIRNSFTNVHSNQNTLSLLEEFSFDKKDDRQTMLRSSNAHLLIRLADVQPHHVLADFVCGVGTIPIEAATGASATPGLAIGADIDPIAIRKAKLNAQSAQCFLGRNKKQDQLENVWGIEKFEHCYRLHPIEFYPGDIKSIPLRDATVDRLIMDMPFGRKCKVVNPFKFYSLTMDEIIRVLRIDGRVVMLAGHQNVINRVLAQLSSKLKKEQQYNATLGGIEVCVYVLVKTQPRAILLDYNTNKKYA